MRNEINEQKKYFTEETETIKKNQINSGNEKLNKQDEECIREHWKQSRTDGKISKLKDKNLKMTQEQEKKKS